MPSADTSVLLAALAAGTPDRPAIIAELRSRGVWAGGEPLAGPVGADAEPGDLYGSEEE